MIHCRTPDPMHWRLCSTVQKTGREEHSQILVNTIDNVDEQHLQNKIISVFGINVPQFGFFETQMNFKTTIQPIPVSCNINTENKYLKTIIIRLTNAIFTEYLPGGSNQE